MTYFKSTIVKVHSAVDFLIMSYMKMALCGRNMYRINTEYIYMYI
jgi:hypothetical protein